MTVQSLMTLWKRKKRKTKMTFNFKDYIEEQNIKDIGQRKVLVMLVQERNTVEMVESFESLNSSMKIGRCIMSYKKKCSFRRG